MKWLRDAILLLGFTLLLWPVILKTANWMGWEADWSVIAQNSKILFSGQYPQGEVWRIWVGLSMISLWLGISWGIWKESMKRLALPVLLCFLFFIFLPFSSSSSKAWLCLESSLILTGYWIGNYRPKWGKRIGLIGVFLLPICFLLLTGASILPSVETRLWGGFLLTLFTSVISFLLSLPLGVMLALGRKSEWPAFRWFGIVYIEVVQGVPLLAILFIAQYILPLFISYEVSFDPLWKIILGFACFNAAYLAEIFRGGLQAVSHDQYDAAKALGFTDWQMMKEIILPQAIFAILPSILSQFIALFKSTSLVTILGFTDLVGIGKKIASNPYYLGSYEEVFFFISILYLFISTLISYVCRGIEKSLSRSR